MTSQGRETAEAAGGRKSKKTRDEGGGKRRLRSRKQIGSPDGHTEK